MIFALYGAIAIILIISSIKIANYVDLIEQKTNLSGALIGGVILAAITSLPELFTSISATLIYKEPGLVMGNVLGSNLFNLCIISICVIIFSAKFIKSAVGISHIKICVMTLICYGALYLTVVKSTEYVFFEMFSSTTLIITVLYIISIRFMSNDDGGSKEDDNNSSLTLKQITARFIICAVILVGASVALTVTTEIIDKELNLGKALAGALFLGVATSLPELTSSLTLAKKGNFNAAIGNVTGSNMFNLIILALTDLMYNKGSVYNHDRQTELLILFGSASMVVTFAIMLFKKQKVTFVPLFTLLCLLPLACYVCFVGFSRQ